MLSKLLNLVVIIFTDWQLEGFFNKNICNYADTFPTLNRKDAGLLCVCVLVIKNKMQWCVKEYRISEYLALANLGFNQVYSQHQQGMLQGAEW